MKDNSFTQTTFRTLKCFEKLISFNNGFTGFQNRLSLKKTDNYLLQKKLTDHFPFNITDASAIPADFSTCRYGFFCRMELKLEKATKVPLRFRLGSLERCNYYEGEQ